MRYGVLVAALLSVSALADEANTRTIAAPRDAVWQKTVAALMAGGYPIASIDKNSGLITTAPKPMKVGMYKTECGKVFFGSPRRGAGHSTTMTVAYNIMLTPQGDSTQAMAVATIAGVFGAHGDPTPLTCKATGLLDAMSAP